MTLAGRKYLLSLYVFLFVYYYNVNPWRIRQGSAFLKCRFLSNSKQSYLCCFLSMISLHSSFMPFLLLCPLTSHTSHFLNLVQPDLPPRHALIQFPPVLRWYRTLASVLFSVQNRTKLNLYLFLLFVLSKWAQPLTFIVLTSTHFVAVTSNKGFTTYLCYVARVRVKERSCQGKHHQSWPSFSDRFSRARKLFRIKQSSLAGNRCTAAVGGNVQFKGSVCYHWESV